MTKLETNSKRTKVRRCIKWECDYAKLILEPIIVKYYGQGENFMPMNEPLPTVTTRDRFMLVEPQVHLDILTRMLQPHELAGAHSFPNGYQFTGKKAEQTKQIGNSVPVELACAHAEAALK